MVRRMDLLIGISTFLPWKPESRTLVLLPVEPLFSTRWFGIKASLLYCVFLSRYSSIHERRFLSETSCDDSEVVYRSSYISLLPFFQCS